MQIRIQFSFLNRAHLSPSVLVLMQRLLCCIFVQTCVYYIRVYILCTYLCGSKNWGRGCHSIWHLTLKSSFPPQYVSTSTSFDRCVCCFTSYPSPPEKEAPYADGCSQIEILQTLKEHGGNGLLPSSLENRAPLSDAFVNFVSDCLKVVPEVRETAWFCKNTFLISTRPRVSVFLHEFLCFHVRAIKEATANSHCCVD